MTNYEKLVEALRCGEYKPECGSSDCPYWSGLGCMDGQLMEDAAAAIEELIGFLAEAERDRDEYEERMEKEQDRVLALQAQLPKRGEWIGVSPMVDTVQCSICGGQLFSAELETPYCPYCGAEMEETEDEVHSDI